MSHNNSPSRITDDYWVYAVRKKGLYPEYTVRGGKWLIFVNVNEIDNVWEVIKKATEDGLLGESSKAATARVNPNSISPYEKVICVYTYDYSDRDDVMRIRQVLRDLGIIKKIPYKTDDATIKGKYRAKGSKRISIYYE